jgi:hypothetical protein
MDFKKTVSVRVKLINTVDFLACISLNIVLCLLKIINLIYSNKIV